MPAAELPENEDERLEVLKRYEILDTLPEEAYDDLVRLALRICGTPIALISLVDGERQWFKSKIGVDANETSRDWAFCGHAILDPSKPLIVKDATQDPRFADNPLVVGEPGIRFYAGAPLVTPEGCALGTVCVIDQEPRELADADADALVCIARQVMSLLDLRDKNAQLTEHASRLQKTNRDLDDFCHIASHDLKEPLRGLRMYSEILLEDYENELDEEGVESLHSIMKLTKRLDGQVQALLDYSRANRLDPHFATLDTRSVVDEALDGVRTSATAKQVRFTVSEELPAISADRTAITHVLQNLISNAIKYNDSTPPVVAIGFDDDAQKFFVRDNGIGIEEQYLDDVFRPFRRLHARDQYEGGTGLGLVIVQRLLDRLGATIEIESEYGAGTTMWLELPLAQADGDDLHGESTLTCGIA